MQKAVATLYRTQNPTLKNQAKESIKTLRIQKQDNLINQTLRKAIRKTPILPVYSP